VSEAPTQGRRVTIRQLLNHTSGLFNYTALADAAANEKKELSHVDLLALIKDKPLDFEPGTSWRYSNTGFYLAGMAVERLTGQPYAAILRDQLFLPFGMKSSSLCTTHEPVTDLAEGHDVRAGALTATAPMTWTLPFAGGGICSTARDLVWWANALESGRVISAASLALMRTPTVLTDGTRIDYGLGTRLGVLQGRAAVGHTGGGGGFSASLITFPAQHLTVVVLTNTGNGGAIPLAAAIARSAFEIGPPALRDSSVPAAEAAAVSGVFDSDSGAIEIYRCGRALCARPPGTEQGQALRRQQAFTYAVDPDLEIRFQPDRRPSVWVFAYNGGLLMDAKRRTAGTGSKK
jgi:D-alanyl-D-alanine carboxypeptidase